MNPHWLALAAAILTSIGGNTMLKLGATGEGSFLTQLFRPMTMLGLCVYGAAAMLYIIALRRIPVSVALPCTAFSYIAAAVIGYHLFGEPLGTQKLAALALICGGVVLLAAA